MGGGKNTIDESYTTFGGGKSWSNGVSAIDAAMSSFHSANRLAFADPSGVLIEYSNSGGETWLDYGASDGVKTAIISGYTNSTSVSIGNKHSSNNDTATLEDKLRITLSAYAMGIYVKAQKLLINVSTTGATGCKCLVELLNNDNVEADAWETYGEYPVSGWTGWNSIPINPPMYFGSNQSGRYHSIRLTFSIGGLSTEYDSILRIYGLMLFAPTAYYTNSNLALTGHLCRINSSGDAIFPAGVRAGEGTGTFTGANFTGLAAKATADANGNNIANTYVRLDGKSTMTDSLKVNRSTYPQFYLTSNQNSEWYNGRIMVGDKNLVLELRQSESDSNKIGISLFGNNSLEKQLQFRKVVNDTFTYYNIYGTHNLTCGTADLTAGTSALNTSCIYLVYE